MHSRSKTASTRSSLGVPITRITISLARTSSCSVLVIRQVSRGARRSVYAEFPPRTLCVILVVQMALMRQVAGPDGSKFASWRFPNLDLVATVRPKLMPEARHGHLPDIARRVFKRYRSCDNEAFLVAATFCTGHPEHSNWAKQSSSLFVMHTFLYWPFRACWWKTNGIRF